MNRCRGLSIFLLAMLSGCVPTAATNVDSPAAAIDMNETGFAPDTANVMRGETVCWKNTGSTPHWPASNIHPTHGIYPAFDPKKGIPPGEQWCFLFGQAGIWRFHDHLQPEFSGVVNVKK